MTRNLENQREALENKRSSNFTNKRSSVDSSKLKTSRDNQRTPQFSGQKSNFVKGNINLERQDKKSDHIFVSDQSAILHPENVISDDFDRKTPNSVVQSPDTSKNYPLDKPSEYALDRPSEWVSRPSSHKLSDKISKPGEWITKTSENQLQSKPSALALDKPSEYNPMSNYNSDCYKLSDL